MRGEAMNAAVVQSFAAPPSYTTYSDPVPAPGELLVTVRAAGLHQIVKSLANGTHYGSTGELPFIPGVDGVGVLEDGTRIYFGGARFPYGTLCEKTVINGRVVIPLPDKLDDLTAAAIANPAMSSWVALSSRANFVPGEKVLILGATGTSGQLAVQIAKRQGASRIVAAGRNPEVLAQLRSLGAHVVISLEGDAKLVVANFKEEFDQYMPDVVLDYLWGSPTEMVLKAMTEGRHMSGTSRIRYVNIGSTAGSSITLPAASLRGADIAVLGSGFGSASLQQIGNSISEFFALAAQQPFEFSLKAAPLSEVESLWNKKENSTRIVFQP